jgi:isopenicillin-N epimerase
MGELAAAPDAVAFKREFLLDPRVTFLNHGSFGACPEPVMQVFQAWQRELEREPVEFLLRRATGLVRESREALAAYVGCGADDLVLFPNATHAMNAAARSLPLGEGDRIVTTDHEYGAMDILWRFVAERTGAHVVQCALPVPLRSPDDVVTAFESVMDESVRVVSLSHITSPTGLVLPIEDICRLARAAGATIVIDGAHGPGQVDLELSSLDADFYAGNCHKWLCSPKSAGFLYTRPGLDIKIDPLVVSWGWDEAELAERAHWQGTLDLSAFLSIPAAIQYQAERDWPSVRARCVSDAVYAYERLRALPGVEPASESAGPMFRQMVSVLLPPTADPELQQKLFASHSIEVPVNDWHDGRLLRISVAAYNDRGDLDRFLDALAPLLRSG